MEKIYESSFHEELRIHPEKENLDVKVGPRASGEICIFL